MKSFRIKQFLLGTVLAVTLFFCAITLAFGGYGGLAANASGAQEITLTAEVSNVLLGTENPEFTVMFKIENNSGKIGGAEFVITPLDDNVSIGTAAQNYVKGDAWTDVNAAARIDKEKNIHILGSDDTGISKSSFVHGGYKFTYQGTANDPIEFNVALEAVCDEIGEENITVKYNGQTLGFDYTQANLIITPQKAKTARSMAARASSPCIVLSSDPAQLYKTDPYQEFTVIARMEGVASVPNGGMYAAAVRITPDQADLLDFVGFVPSKDILQSALLAKSQHTEGINVLMEGGNNGISAVTEDFNVGSFKFKLKSSVTTIPESLSFSYESVDSADWYGDKVEMAGGTFTLNFSEKPPATPVTKPTASGGTTSGYSGSPIDFTPSGMAELVSSGKVNLFSVSESGAETKVGIDAFKPTNVGSYKVVARPAEGFCWEGGDDSDVEFTFSVNKAVLTATPGAEGELPTFKSDSYKGSLDNIIEYKYYSDAACTQEIAKSALTPGEKYYVKPVLKDGANGNFEFATDSVTQGFLSGGTEYVEPEKGGLGDILGLPWWVWIIIAAAVVLLIILLIILIVVRKKKDKSEERKTLNENLVAATTVQPQSVIIPQVESVTEKAAATAEKAEKLEDRMRDMEREVHENEIARYKEEAERAEKRADKSESSAQPIAAQTVATDTAAQERVKELEARMHEMECEAHEREVTRYKEEVERAEKKADEIKREQPVFVQTAQQSVQSDTDAKIDKLSEEIRRRDEELKKQLQQQAETQRETEHVREKERLAALTESAEKEAAELREKLKAAEQEKALAAQFAQEKALHFVPASIQSKKSGTEDAEVDAETYAMLKAYEDRLRSMEREMQERKMETMIREENERAKKEMEDAARMRRHEDEMQRLHELQQQEQMRRRETPQPYYGQYAPQPQQPPQATVYSPAMDYQRRQQELEMQRLQLLEEQLKQKELENRLLNEQIRQQYAAYPPYGYPTYPPYGTQPQSPFGETPQSPFDPNGKKRNT